MLPSQLLGLTREQNMRILGILILAISLYPIGMLIVRLGEAGSERFPDILSVGLFYLIGFVTICFVLDKIDQARRVKEVGRDNRFDEVPESLGWIVVGFMGIIQVGIIILVLWLSTLINLSITLPIWSLIIYGAIIGCGSAAIMWWWGSNDNAVTNNVLVTWIVIIFYPVIMALLVHFFNLNINL